MDVSTPQVFILKKVNSVLHYIALNMLVCEEDFSAEL